MATSFENVHLLRISENGESKPVSDSPVRLKVSVGDLKVLINVLNGSKTLEGIHVTKEIERARVGSKSLLLTSGDDSYLLKFSSLKDLKAFNTALKGAIERRALSVFNLRTETTSAEQYFQFYGYLSQQQNMMQDYIRTSTYQRAMLDNNTDFQDKIVLDVGAGSGILSFFAIQAGAKKVYAIEASSMAKHCETLVRNNNLQERIVVVAGKVEEVDIPEMVDIIISEPMGYMLFNERMLESFLHAKKWLKPGGKMFPTQGDLHITPFTDDALYMEQFSKANFWYQPSFHGVDLSSLREAAVEEYFTQPIVDTFDVRICLARTHKYVVDFQTTDEEALHHMNIPFSFNMTRSGTVHGLAFWFDVAFLGSESTVWLSTAPTQPLTHWYQVRCLLRNPVFVKQGQTLVGKVDLKSNARQSYDVDIEVSVAGTNTVSKNTLDLKNPFFRYTGQQPAAPPGTENTSPSEAYWTQQQEAEHTTQYGMNLLNGTLAADATLQQQQQQQQQQQLVPQSGVMHNNLVPLGSSPNMAPVNPGSIPAATVVSFAPAAAAQQAIQARTSVGGGISPQLFTTTAAQMHVERPASSDVHFGQPASSPGAPVYPVSNQFMIGDYVLPGNMVLPTQGLNFTNFKAGGGV